MGKTCEDKPDDSANMGLWGDPPPPLIPLLWFRRWRGCPKPHSHRTLAGAVLESRALARGLRRAELVSQGCT